MHREMDLCDLCRIGLSVRDSFSMNVMMTPDATILTAPQFPTTPDEAFAELKAGNDRFLSGTTKRGDLLAEANSTKDGPKAFAVVVSCIDSRTSAELIFDQGIGHIFNTRLAGNIVDDAVLGSVEFATKVVGAKLIAVIGHTGCGAVLGAIGEVDLGHLTGVLNQIKPAVTIASSGIAADACTTTNADFVAKCTEENVRLQMRRIIDQSPIVKELLDSGSVRLVGGVHDLASGKVHFLD